MGELSDLELGILRCIYFAGEEARLTPADVAPAVGMSLEQVTDRLNELEWVGYVTEHEGVDGAPTSFSLTADGRDAATSESL
jgi:hypothetical protein